MKEATLVFHLKIKPLPTDKDSGYIFYHSSEGIEITAFVKNQYVFFGIPKRNILGLPEGNELIDYVKTRISMDDKPIILSFFYSCEDNKVTLSIYLGAKKVEEKEFLIPLCNSDLILHEKYTLGSDTHQKNYGYFDLYESMVYRKLLTNDELSQLKNYFLQKKQGNYLEFNGNAFFFKDLNTNSLVQSNPKFQPKYIRVE